MKSFLDALFVVFLLRYWREIFTVFRNLFHKVEDLYDSIFNEKH